MKRKPLRILVIIHQYPMYDRASGDLRFFQMLEMLASRHHVSLTSYNVARQVQVVGPEETNRYRGALIQIGITIEDHDPMRVIHNHRFDVVLYEFYKAACDYPISEVRLLQKRAVTVIDSVDVHFNRFFARARLTGSEQDRQEAVAVKQRELEMYRTADHVIAVSAADREVLRSEEPGLSVGVIPNIHHMHALNDARDRERNTLLFVGGFAHDPNVDAVQYLCREIMPLVWQRVPAATLRIVGDSPPSAIRQLAKARIEVVGYVPDLQPYLQTSQISVAPLRYGGGMKGKIGEAMAAGLPVVTTSVGVEGFGLSPGKNVLVGDEPEHFSSSVVRLLLDRMFYEAIRRAGWQFIAQRFSPEVVKAELLRFFDEIAVAPRKSLSPKERVKMLLPYPVVQLIRRYW